VLMHATTRARMLDS